MREQSLTKNTQPSFDAIVIGGGPAGSVCACRLAGLGFSVLLLEKSQFPRLHVGESTVPYLTELLDRLGVLEAVEQEGFVCKRGVEFSDARSDGFGRMDFDTAAPGQKTYAYNVDRPRFDALLLKQAELRGVRVLDDAEVREFLFDGERMCGVVYQTGGERRAARARFVVDASGRAGLISRHFKLRRMNPRLRNMAVYQQFTGLIPGNNPSIAGDLVVTSHEEGWLWCMPIGEDLLSVGAVMPAAVLKGRDPQEVFAAHVERSVRIRPRIQGARPVFAQAKVESDWSYYSDRLAGPGFFLVGDAGCFVDPMFSGGVYFAMVAGFKAADVMSEILGGRDEREARDWYEHFCKTAYDVYFRLVFDVYDSLGGDFMRLFGFYPCDPKYLTQTILGDFWGRPDQPLLAHLRAQPGRQTFGEPFEVITGCPIYPDTCFKVGDDLLARAA